VLIGRKRIKLIAMCGRYTLTPAIDDLLRQLGFTGMPAEMPPRYNIAPTQMVPALLKGDSRELEAGLFRWGLIPSWAKDMSIGNRMINARGETVAEKPSFRSAFRRRRCLILSDGWYEWQKTPEGKQPVRIQLESEGVFAFAGLWERWMPGEEESKKGAKSGGEAIHSCAIITSDACRALKGIHHRMPVVMKRDRWNEWLDPDASVESLKSMVLPYMGDDLKVYPVSTLVNSPANDRQECIFPLDEAAEH
jgi:putative SOS response-associated peptidase YedK